MYTLTMTTNFDWNNEGLSAGFKTVALDWEDWKRPVMSRLSAKLFRNKTCNSIHHRSHEKRDVQTRFEIAVLNSTSNMSSCADRSMLCIPGNTSVNSLSLHRMKVLPSKSRATISSFSVGVTDIHTPSVVRISDPANDVSTRWFNA